jgi:outer membrane murein-binding lipoprotein Lpp
VSDISRKTVCEPNTQEGCQLRITSLEKAVSDLKESNRRLEQSNRELSDDVRAAMAESKRRSESLDNLAKILLASNEGIELSGVVQPSSTTDTTKIVKPRKDTSK